MNILEIIKACGAHPLYDMTNADPTTWMVADFTSLKAGNTALFRLRPIKDRGNKPGVYVECRQDDMEQLSNACATHQITPVLLFDMDWLIQNRLFPDADAALNFLDHTRQIVQHVMPELCPLLIKQPKLLPEVQDIWRTAAFDGEVYLKCRAKKVAHTDMKKVYPDSPLLNVDGVAFAITPNLSLRDESLGNLQNAFRTINAVRPGYRNFGIVGPLWPECRKPANP